MAHLLQLGRPEAMPRLPVTAEAAPLTPPLSEVRSRILPRTTTPTHRGMSGRFSRESGGD